MHTHPAWHELCATFNLSSTQADQLYKHYELVTQINPAMNLTAITTPLEFLAYHIRDSLAPLALFPALFQQAQMIADVGTGGGFPGIPLAIACPQAKVVLIEVILKKARFLQEVIEQLGLQERVQVSTYDWRSFLRATNEPIDLFVARASLRPDELVRAFEQGSHYRSSKIVYFASATWEAEKSYAPCIAQDIPYTTGDRTRRLILLKRAGRGG
jgi:16S rRNA (guanine527-N7)-methyltransferase